MKTLLNSTLLVLTLTLSSCGKKENKATDSSSTVSSKVTHVDQTKVKRQSIGNCWIYATASWAESLHLTATGEEVNISESYWTYWNFYYRLLKGNFLKEKGKRVLSTGGMFSDSRYIIRNHGLVFEGDFAPKEKNWEMSKVQARAERFINQAIRKGGELFTKRQRTPNRIIRLLNMAFNVKIHKIERKAIDADDFVTGVNRQGKEISLLKSLRSWNKVLYDVDNQSFYRTNEERKEVLRRVLKALNDGKPVIMSVYVEFTAINKRRMLFNTKTLRKNRRKPRWKANGGWHMLVLHDYAIKNVRDEEGKLHNLKEGEYEDGDYLKSLILDEDLARDGIINGRLLYLKAKNSWGTKRPERGLTDGYSRFSLNYLNFKGKKVLKVGDQTALDSFILPPGY